ncbi:AzlC family protein [Neisseria meningitidis]|nr:AzlC family protein [Neisseria meningitidis]
MQKQGNPDRQVGRVWRAGVRQYFQIYSGLTKTGTALPRLSSKRTIL